VWRAVAGLEADEEDDDEADEEESVPELEGEEEAERECRLVEAGREGRSRERRECVSAVR
jgi:hypothetical protein